MLPSKAMIFGKKIYMLVWCWSRIGGGGGGGGRFTELRSSAMEMVSVARVILVIVVISSSCGGGGLQWYVVGSSGSNERGCLSMTELSMRTLACSEWVVFAA